MDRCHRIGQTRPVHVYRLATSHSVEVWFDDISHLQSLNLLLWLKSCSGYIGLLIISSLQGRIIKKAFGKLKLEHVVIGKGQFEQERAKPNVLNVIAQTHPKLL